MWNSETYNQISLHIWLIFSSYGIMFAILSFLEDLGCLDQIKEKYVWFKGVLSILLGLVFYRIVGLPHIKVSQNRN